MLEPSGLTFKFLDNEAGREARLLLSGYGEVLSDLMKTDRPIEEAVAVVNRISALLLQALQASVSAGPPYCTAQGVEGTQSYKTILNALGLTPPADSPAHPANGVKPSLQVTFSQSGDRTGGIH